VKYVCLGYHDERAWAALPEGERRSLLQETQAYEQELLSRGLVSGGTALQSADSATTLRFKAGEMTVTDGPFAETKEQLGGFMVLEAKDLNDAIRLLSRMPCMRIGGSLEIRGINEQVYGELEAEVNTAIATPDAAAAR